MEKFFTIIIASFLLYFSIQDIKKRSISGIHLIIMAIFCFVSLFIYQNISVIQHILGGIMGIVFLIISKVTNESIGFADSIIVCLLGTVFGFYELSGILLWSFSFSGVYAFFYLCLRKRGRKATIPLIPFLFCGFLFLQFI